MQSDEGRGRVRQVPAIASILTPSLVSPTHIVSVPCNTSMVLSVGSRHPRAFPAGWWLDCEDYVRRRGPLDRSHVQGEYRLMQGRKRVVGRVLENGGGGSGVAYPTHTAACIRGSWRLDYTVTIVSFYESDGPHPHIRRSPAHGSHTQAHIRPCDIGL